MRVIVLGAGLLGVTSAYFLQQLGHEVTVIDRQGAPGAETSFANGGQISVSHAEPWANPSAPLKVLQWLGKEDAPLLFRIRADMRQWLWGLSFCATAPRRARATTSSRSCAWAPTAAACCSNCARTRASSTTSARRASCTYTNQRSSTALWPRPSRCAVLGCERQVISADEAVRIEPAWPIRPQLAGATFTAEDESGDANQFTRELAKLCGRRACSSAWGTITALREVGGSIDHVN